MKRQKKTLCSVCVCVCRRIETCGRSHKAVNFTPSKIAGGDRRIFFFIYPLELDLSRVCIYI